MFERGNYLYILFVNYISADMLEEHVVELRDLDLEVEQDIIILDDREDQWKKVVEVNKKDSIKVHDLMWEVYMKYKEQFINRQFLVQVTHPKGGIFFDLCEG